jgi:hypothetical protein
MYPDRVLIKGFNPETSKDGLINYLEAKSGEDVKDVVYGEEEGTAIVTFEELNGLFLLSEAYFDWLVEHYSIEFFIFNKVSQRNLLGYWGVDSDRSWLEAQI